MCPQILTTFLGGNFTSLQGWMTPENYDSATCRTPEKKIHFEPKKETLYKIPALNEISSLQKKKESYFHFHVKQIL